MDSIVGVICEYNPLHLGHVHHLRAIRARAPESVIVCVMSGSWVQRGEPAIIDKWRRARMALASGADVVLELPSPYSVRAARDFSRAGVTVLKMLGIKTIAFGSEVDDEALMRAVARALYHEPPAMSASVRQGLDLGWSHARALTHALATAGGLPHPPHSVAGALARPNFMLGAEYLRAGLTLAWPLDPLVIRREEVHPGAQTLRALWQEDGLGALEGMVPDATMDVLREAEAHRAAPAARDALDPMALDALRERSGFLIGLPDWEPGLDRRMGEAAQKSASVSEALIRAKCKRYPMARLRRLTAHLMLGATSEVLSSHRDPEYARVLGIGPGGRRCLRAWRDAGLPVVTRTAALRDHPVYAIERRATDLAALCAPARRWGDDATMGPVLYGF